MLRGTVTVKPFNAFCFTEQRVRVRLFQPFHYYASSSPPYYLNVHSKKNNLELKWLSFIRDHDEKQCKRWAENLAKDKRSFILAMFPYPSGNLHLGHLRVYTVADVLARYKTMRGYAVLQPMGWDAFGLPAENAAIDRNILPASWTSSNIQQMREQIDSTMLLGLNWSRELSTCDPTYYKWTQWLFLKLYKSGLAYRRSAFVNWDPVDQTVLADELVDAQGRSWRSGALVERIPLCQWYFRTSVYSQSLLDGLKDIEGNQWRDVIQMQRGWLGNLDGTQIEFDLVQTHSNEAGNQQNLKEATGRSGHQEERLSMFTKEPHFVAADLISHIDVTADSIYFSDRYRMPEHKRGLNFSRKLFLCCGDAVIPGEDSRKLSIVSTSSASPWPEQLAVAVVHPFTGRSIPMIRQPALRIPRSMAFPDIIRTVLDEKHRSTAEILDLSPPPASVSSVTESGEPVGSLDNAILVTPVSELNGVCLADAVEKSMELLKRTGRGGYWSSESRTDWLVSRQRYWGTPIPIIHCNACGTVPVPEDQLPVLLPPLKEAFKRGASPLLDNLEWRKTNCPNCGGPAERETDTLDTFVDSSWYYLRYLDPHNNDAICDPQKASDGLPVDVYVGGIEHGIRHLFYARFISHFLHDLGVMPCREPFLRFLPVGLVLGQTFVEPRSGRFVEGSQVKKQVDKKGNTVWTELGSGLPVVMCWDKMSKSKLNGVDPIRAVQKHGIEVVRLTMLANVGPHRARKWQENDGVLRGIVAWQSKLSRLLESLVQFAASHAHDEEHGDWHLLVGPKVDPLWGDDSIPSASFRAAHENTVTLVNYYYDESFVLSAIIARLQETTEMLRRAANSAGGPGPQSFLYVRVLADLIVMLTPLAPILSCELWSSLQHALHFNAPSSLRKQLQSLTDDRTSCWWASWPYDLTKSALEQPFPSIPTVAVEQQASGCPSLISAHTRSREETVSQGA